MDKVTAASIVLQIHESHQDLKDALRELEVACGSCVFEMANKELAIAYIQHVQKFHELLGAEMRA